MQNRLAFVTQAADTLNSSLGTPQERLVKAGKEFWAATLCPEDWPSGLLDEAKRIRNILPAGGPARATLERMAPEAAVEVGSQLSKDMSALAANLRQIKGSARPARR